MSNSKETASVAATSTAIAPAVFSLNSPNAILFPDVRVDTIESTAVSISNSATAPAAGLDVTGFAAGVATVAGSISDLPAGGTDPSAISVGLDAVFPGVNYGEVLLSPVSDAGNGNTLALAGTVIDLFGEAFSAADPIVQAVTLYTRVGAPGTVALTVSNYGAATTQTEDLIAALSGTSGGIGIGNAGPTGDITSGASDQSLTLTFSTAQAGTITGTATVAATTDGGTGAGSIDGLGTAELTPVDVPVNITVDNLAQATFESGGSPISGGTLDLGNVDLADDGYVNYDLELVNTGAGPADLLAGSVSFSDSDGGFSGFSGNFVGVGSGQEESLSYLSLFGMPNSLFVATITVTPESVLPDGSDPVALPAETLVLEANTYGEYYPCFLAGTHIATPTGAAAVEALRVGDLVCTAAGVHRPVIWIGQRRISQAAAQGVAPVRIRRGGFGRDRPCRDLLLSPDHAVFAEGVLIPVRHLIDGVGIVQSPMRQAHYFHIELDCHDIVLAEGLAVESYLDAGSRAAFLGGKVAALAPDFATRVWEAQGCAPLRLIGPEVDAVRARLATARVGRRSRAA